MESIALVHDWLTGMRGGEKVLEVLCKRFPDAPLWTLVHNQGSVSERITSRAIHTSFLQYCPFSARKYRLYLPLFPFFAETNKADGDIIVSTSHAVAKAMVKRSRRRNNLHVCYIHTPMRYAWDLFDEYFGVKRVGMLASRFFYRPIMNALQRYDRMTLDRVDVFIANSTYVAERVTRIYGREAYVLHPPVDIGRYILSKREPEDWYLIVSSLVPYKRVEQGIDACGRLGRRLKIVGSGPERERLELLAKERNADVEFLGFVSDEKLVDFYRKAKALIFPGIEDFGIVPVEAIAAGCPVLAYGEGGILDSMTEQTAVLYSQQSSDGLLGAIQDFEKRPQGFPELVLKQNSEMFSEDKFLSGFELILERSIEEKRRRDTKK